MARAAQAALQTSRLYRASPVLATARLLREWWFPERQPISLADEDIEPRVA